MAGLNNYRLKHRNLLQVEIQKLKKKRVRSEHVKSRFKSKQSLWNSGVGGYIISPKISGLKRSIL